MMDGFDRRLHLDRVASLEEFDRQHARAVDMLRDLAVQREHPRAFVLITAADYHGALGVETVAACPTDAATTAAFVELATSAFAEFMARFR
jgi:hypothetical protein